MLIKFKSMIILLNVYGKTKNHLLSGNELKLSG